MTPLEQINARCESTHLDNIFANSAHIELASAKCYDFEVDVHPVYNDESRFTDASFCTKTEINANVVSAFQDLPVGQILGSAVLVRVPQSVTALLTIGEAAKLLLNQADLQMLSILMQVIAENVSTPHQELKPKDFTLRWRQEISEEEKKEQDKKERWRKEWERREERKWERERERESERERQREGERQRERERKREREREREMETERWDEREQEMERRFIYGGWLSRTGDDNDRLHQQMADLEDQQLLLSEKMDDVQRQNTEILRLLRTGSRSNDLSSVVSETPTPKGTQTVSAVAEPCRTGPKYWTRKTTIIGLRSHAGRLFICTGTSIPSLQALVTLLHLLLGGTDPVSFGTPFECIRLGLENTLYSSDDSVRVKDSTSAECWRDKLLDGNILLTATSTSTETTTPSYSRKGLHLTAAALWSLFDNALSLMENCRCTFRAEGGGFLQCVSREGKWLIWHAFNNGETCNGKLCSENVAIALNGNDTGERLLTNTPCILGWSAYDRSQPGDCVWDTLPASAKFTSNKLSHYEFVQLQTNMQLSVPTLVSPQFGVGASFSKRYYKVANSMDESSDLALAQAAVATVLIYDETQKIHLAFEGADLIEMICIEALRRAAYDTTLMPMFQHSTALARLETWRHCNFVSFARINIAGEDLVRQAVRKMARLIELSIITCSGSSTFAYWSLEDVLKSREGYALKSPSSYRPTWHLMTYAVPTLMLVVGKLKTEYLVPNMSALSWNWQRGKTKPRHKLTIIKGLSDFFRSASTYPHGLLATENIVTKWMTQSDQATQLYFSKTVDRIWYGEGDEDFEPTYSCTPAQPGHQIVNKRFNCSCKTSTTERCLHFIQ